MKNNPQKSLGATRIDIAMSAVQSHQPDSCRSKTMHVLTRDGEKIKVRAIGAGGEVELDGFTFSAHHVAELVCRIYDLEKEIKKLRLGE